VGILLDRQPCTYRQFERTFRPGHSRAGLYEHSETHPSRYSEHIRGDFRKNHRDGRFTSLTMAATKSRGAWNWILGRSTHPRAYSRLPSINPLPSNPILPVSFLVRVSAHLRGEGKESVKSGIWTFNLKLRKPLKHIRTFRLLLLSSRVKVISWFRVEIPWDDRRDPSSSIPSSSPILSSSSSITGFLATGSAAVISRITKFSEAKMISLTEENE